ncbi:entericidin A/B family lipoprotein [Halomonas sp. Bachu 37]
MKRSILVVLMAILTISLLSGCNTIRGAGEDIEEGGQAIQRSTT